MMLIFNQNSIFFFSLTQNIKYEKLDWGELDVGASIMRNWDPKLLKNTSHEHMDGEWEVTI